MLFWAITLQVVVIPYRCFGTTYRSYLQRSRIQESLTLEDGTDRLCRNIGKEIPVDAASKPRRAQFSSSLEFAWITFTFVMQEIKRDV